MKTLMVWQVKICPVCKFNHFREKDLCLECSNKIEAYQKAYQTLLLNADDVKKYIPRQQLKELAKELKK